MKKTLLATALAAFWALPAAAETYQFGAASDFPVIDAGEIPYYRDTAGGKRDWLAINAAITDYRDRFARAETSFSGDEGLYDVTLTALGEIDGEGQYRLFVNDTLIGSAKNSRVDSDYGDQEHVFKDVYIPAGATLAIESNAVTNGLIPEGDGTAFARGRWRLLTLANDEAAADTADLSLTLHSDADSLTSGESLTVSLSVDNHSPGTTATGVTASMTVNEHLDYTGSNCTQDGAVLDCKLGNLAAGESRTLDLNFTALSAGTAALQASASADQNDPDNSNNAASLAIPVIAQSTTTDLVVDFTATGNADALAVTVTNAGDNTSPAQTLEIEASSTDTNKLLLNTDNVSCIVEQNTAACDIESLTTGTSQTIHFALSTDIDTSAEITATLDWDDDEAPSNNTQTLTLGLKAPLANGGDGNTNNAAGETNSDGGGGGVWWLTSFILAGLGAYRRKRRWGQTNS
ncbi:MAG: hypothetical protein KDJ38_01655 [Gammaproteobacteria bacterium]|nr:hypothetical protein [Gammaproteobacteria bacterium]